MEVTEKLWCSSHEINVGFISFHLKRQGVIFIYAAVLHHANKPLFFFVFRGPVTTAAAEYWLAPYSRDESEAYIRHLIAIRT